MTRQIQNKNEKTESSLAGWLTLAASFFFYLLFHLRVGSGFSATCAATLGQLLLTVPYTLGFTYLLIYTHRRISGDQRRPPWRHLCRVFFTVGICFGLFFALYEYGGGDPWSTDASSVGGFWGDVFQKLPWR